MSSIENVREGTGVREPQQARSARTMARIEEAAMELILQGGVDAVSIQDVVKRARSSVGSFYARFQSRDQLIDHLRTKSSEAALRRWDAALGTLGSEASALAETVHGVTGLIVDALRQEAALSEFFRGQGLAQGEPDSPLTARMVDTVSPVVLRHREEIRHEQPEVAAVVGLRMVIAGAEVLLKAPPVRSDGTPLESEALVKELGLCYLRYLGEGGDGAHEESGAGTFEGDPFDVWA